MLIPKDSELGQARILVWLASSLLLTYCITSRNKNLISLFRRHFAYLFAECNHSQTISDFAGLVAEDVVLGFESE